MKAMGVSKTEGFKEIIEEIAVGIRWQEAGFENIGGALQVATRTRVKSVVVSPTSSAPKERDAGLSLQTILGQKRLRKGRKKEIGAKNAMLSHVDGFIEVSRTMWVIVAAPIVPRSLFIPSEALQELAKYSEIFEDLDLYDFATSCFIDPAIKVIFLNLSTDRKVAWSKKRYIDSLQRRLYYLVV